MRSLSVCAVALMAAVSPAWAQQQEAAANGDAAKSDRLIPGKFSGTATVATDYVFRGISQTNEKAAVQAGIEWRHDLGPFLGVWGSSVDFADGDQASLELDWYGGYAGSFRAIEYDVRVIYYNYPGADVGRDYDFWELGLALTYTPVTDLGLTFGYNFSPDYFAESGTAHYLRGEAAYTFDQLPVPVTVTAGVAYQFINNNAAFGTPDYWHWGAGVAVDVDGLSLGVTYSDTDIDKDRCGGGLDVCGARFVANATYSF